MFCNPGSTLSAQKSSKSGVKLKIFVSVSLSRWAKNHNAAVKSISLHNKSKTFCYFSKIPAEGKGRKL